MSSKIVSRHPPQLFRSKSQRLVVSPETAERLDFRGDGNRRVCCPACLAGNLDCLIQRAQGLLVFVPLDQTHSVHARVSDMSAWVECFRHRPGLHHVFFRRRDIAEQVRCYSLLTNRTHCQQVMVFLIRQCFDL